MSLGEKISVSSSWSRDEDIAFERALAIYIDETESPWEKIATAVPEKIIEEIIEHYNILTHDVMTIESGCGPLPDYDSPEEPNHNANDKEISILECGNNRKCEFKQKGKSEVKQKRRKGIAWTSTEHRQFLLGLEQYGKGDWRSISRNSVVTRTPTQVASHAQKYFARLKSKNRNKNRTSIHDITVAENKYIPQQRPITWQNRSINLVATSNNQAIQTTLQPSLDLHIHGRPNIWNTQATQAISQPSLNHPTYGAPTIWNTQAAKAISQPSLNHPTYGAPTIWNTQATKAISQPSLNHPTYGAPTIWNTQAALQPSANVPLYGTSTISQPMVGPMLSPFEVAQPHMTSEVQNYSVPCYSGPSVPINIDSIPFDIDCLSKFQR